MSDSKTVQEIKDECIAWEKNCIKLGLDDRIEFQKWLYETFSPTQLAVMIDFEMEWEVLWDCWLRSLG